MSKRKRKSSQVATSNYQTADEKRAAKKAAVLGTRSKSTRLPLFLGIGITFFALLGGGLLYSTSGNNDAPLIPAVEVAESISAAASAASEIVAYQESMFMDGMAKFFSFQHKNLTIKYFVLKSADGVFRAAFDACDVCWPAGKGYYQDGDHMVCRNCGQRFESVKINEVKGGCNPSPLNRTLKDGQVVIKVKDLIEGQYYFDFSQHT